MGGAMIIILHSGIEVFTTAIVPVCVFSGLGGFWYLETDDGSRYEISHVAAIRQTTVDNSTATH
jgi:hypothetical protein